MSHSISRHPPVISDGLPGLEGYILELANTSMSVRRQDPEIPCQCDVDANTDTNEATCSKHELGHKECIDDEIERPTSRQANYRSRARYGSRCPHIPPLKVPLYPFVLNGYPGHYTLAQICRYAEIEPTRGTAMQLRRFVLLNDFLDRTKAVGYERPATASAASDGTPDNSDLSRRRWPGHGTSKLRNEISLEDLINDDSVREILFNSASIDNSFNSRHSSDNSTSSKYSDDFEVPMELTSSFEEDDVVEDIHNVLREYERDFEDVFENTFSELTGCEDLDMDETETF